jgi:hypothetical protein
MPDHSWQHISMDFKLFPHNKNSYNTILVVIDRLSK